MRNLKQKACAWILAAGMILSGMPATAVADDSGALQTSTEAVTEKTGETETEKTSEKGSEKESEKESETTSEKESEQQQTEKATEQSSEKDAAETEKGSETAADPEKQKETQASSETDSAAGDKQAKSGDAADDTKATEKEEPVSYVNVEMQIVDEDGNIIGGSRARELPEFKKELVLNDPEKAPFEIEYYQFKEAKIEDETIDSLVKTASEKEKDGSYRYAYAVVSGKKQTALTKDTLITLSYEQVYNRTDYSGSDGAVSVTAVLENKEAVPDNAVLAVTGVTGGNGYNYDAYMSALGSLSDAVPYSSYNTLLYDIAFMVPEKDEVGKETGRMIEYQPEAGSVSIQITFNGDQLSEQLGAADPAYVKVTHLALSDQVRGMVDSTAAATGISPAQIRVEPLGASVSLEGSTDSAAFSVSDFSVFAFSYMVDFVYDGYKFDLEGADSVLLSQLFEKLGIEAEAEKAIIAQISDESLISIEREDADWRLTSTAPFKTEETLTVTMADGAKYVIGVTNDVTVEAKVRSVDEDGKPLGDAGIRILDEEGETVAKWTSDEEDYVVEDLEPGVEYTLREEEAPEGYLPAKDSTFVLKEDGAVDLKRTTAAVLDGVLLLAGEPENAEIHIWTYDIMGFVPGAEFEILDSSGKVVAVIAPEEGAPATAAYDCTLPVGFSYILHETKAPVGPEGGYFKADDIEFSLERNDVGTIVLKIGGEETDILRTIIVRHKKLSVSIRKVDDKSNYLPDAQLQVLTTDQESLDILEEWTSGEEDHEISEGLSAGTDYIIHEEKTPEGYETAGDAIFRLEEDGTVTVVESEDGKVRVENGVLIVEDTKLPPEEAKGSLTLAGTKYIYLDGLYGYEYRALKESDIFTFEIKEIESGQTWTVQNDSTGKIHYPTFNYVRNKDRDDTGKHTYKIRETTPAHDGLTPDGYLYTIEVNVKDDGSEKLQINVSGVDDFKEINFYNEYKAKGSVTVKAGKALAGEKLQAGDFQFEFVHEDGSVIYTVSNAADGSVTFPTIEFLQGWDGTYTYTIREKLPAGVDKNHPFKGGVYYDTKTHKVTLTAKDDGKGKMLVSAVYDGKSSKDIPSFVNYLVPIRVRKLSSATGNYVYGAKMQLKAGSKVLESWTTADYEYMLYGLDPGVTYTLHEVSAPNGYSVSKDVTFTLAADGSFLKSKTTADISSDGALIVYDDLVTASSSKTGTGGAAIGRRGPIVNYETGDDTPIALYVGLLAAAAALVILLLVLRRKKRK